MWTALSSRSASGHDACPGLSVRLEDGCAFTYPQWVPMAVESAQVVRHELADDSWQGCLAAVVGLADDQLDVRRMPWRLHVFMPVLDIPGVTGVGCCSGHAGSACAGRRRSRFGDGGLVVRPPGAGARRDGATAGFLPWRAVEAARTHRQLVRDIRAGLLAPGIGSRPPLATNARPNGARSVRTLVRHRSQLRGPTVTVAVLAAVSSALSDLLGDSAKSLGAEVPMAKPGVRHAHNHFGNVVVGLYPELDRDARAERIAADLANGRRRFEHPATRSADRAFAAMPAALLRWGVSQFDPDVRPAQVAGNTVVSSVYRGPADLSFGGVPVVLTAGYPALSPSMGLTHGVHGIGDTVAISVHAAESAVPDVDAYLRLLDSAL